MLIERLLAILEARPELRAVAESIVTWYPLAHQTDPDLSNYLAILADREFEDQSPAAMEQELRTVAAALRDEHVSRERQRLEEEMRDAERTGDQARIRSLLAQFHSLDT
jgi:hypothetical protein